MMKTKKIELQQPEVEQDPEELVQALTDQAQQAVFSLIFKKLGIIEKEVKPVKKLAAITRQVTANTTKIAKNTTTTIFEQSTHVYQTICTDWISKLLI